MTVKTYDPDMEAVSAKPRYTALNDDDRIELSRVAWVPKVDLSYAEWASQGFTIQELKRVINFLLGDWYNYGKEHFGMNADQAIILTDLDYEVLQKTSWVSRCVPPSIRRPELSWSHHRLIALEDVSESVKAELLQAAIDGEMNRDEFKDYVTAWRVVNLTQTPTKRLEGSSTDPSRKTERGAGALPEQSSSLHPRPEQQTGDEDVQKALDEIAERVGSPLILPADPEQAADFICTLPEAWIVKFSARFAFLRNS